jgi:hypothetical protein
MGASLEVRAVGEGQPDPDRFGDLSQRMPDLIQREHVDAFVLGRRSRHDEVDVLGHPPKPEVHFAQQRAALEKGLITEGLAERPEQPRQVEVLLDDVGL